MAINLLGNTPVKIPASSSLVGGNYSLSPSMGVAAKTPVSNLSSPSTTLPKNQVATNSNLTANKGSLLSNAAAAAPKTSTIGSGISIAPSGKAIPSSYTIQSGDTLSSIASKYGVDPQQLAISNNLTNPNSIQAGGTLNFPTYKSNSSGGTQTATNVSSGGGSTGGGSPQTDAAASIPAGQSGTPGSLGNQYTQNAQGQWVLGGTPGTQSAPPTANNSSYTYDANGNIVANPNAASGTAGSADPTIAQPLVTPGTGGMAGTTQFSASNPPTSQAGLLGAALGQAQGYYNTQGGLTDKIQALDTNFANKEAALGEGYTGLGANTPLEAQGLENIKNNAVAAISNQQATQAQYESPLASLYGSAINATAPQLQAGMLTNPLNGQPLNPSLVSSAIQQATKLVQNGTPVTDPSVQALLNPFGYYGASAFTQAEQTLNGGNYNPAQQSAAAEQNVSQATTAQGTAFTLDTSLKQLSTEQPLISNFLQSSGLNSQLNPNFNNSLNTYYGQFLSPGNKQLMDGYFADIKKYTSQILAANTGTIPSDVASTLASFDPSSLSVDQLVPFMEGLQQLGGNQLSVTQSQQQASGGSSNAYTGTPTAPATNPVIAPIQSNPGVPGKNSPVIQALIGGTINAWDSVAGLFKSIF